MRDFRQKLLCKVAALENEDCLATITIGQALTGEGILTSEIVGYRLLADFGPEPIEFVQPRRTIAPRPTHTILLSRNYSGFRD